MGFEVGKYLQKCLNRDVLLIIARAAAEKWNTTTNKTINLIPYTLHLEFDTHLADYEYSTEWISIRFASLFRHYFFYIFCLIIQFGFGKFLPENCRNLTQYSFSCVVSDFSWSKSSAKKHARHSRQPNIKKNVAYRFPEAREFTTPVFTPKL